MTTLSGGISMRTRTVLLFGGAAAAGAAAIGATTAALLAADTDARVDIRTNAAYRSLAELFFRMPLDADPPAPGQRPALVLVKDGLAD